MLGNVKNYYTIIDKDINLCCIITHLAKKYILSTHIKKKFPVYLFELFPCKIHYFLCVDNIYFFMKLFFVVNSNFFERKLILNHEYIVLKLLK